VLSNAHPGISCLGLEQHVCQWQRQLLAKLANEATSHSVVAALCSLPARRGLFSAIMPPPAAAAAPHMSAAHLEHIKALRAEGIARLGRDPKLQHPKRVLQDVAVGPGAYIRYGSGAINPAGIECPVDVTAASSLLLVDRQCYLEPAEVPSAAAVAIGAI